MVSFQAKTIEDAIGLHNTFVPFVNPPNYVKILPRLRSMVNLLMQINVR